MKIQGYTNNQYRYNTQAAQANSPTFGGVGSFAKTAFEKTGEFCNVDSRNGSLSRTMFFIVATLFLLGGRFIKSRDNDERREVVIRDVPAIALSVAGAPMLNKAMAYGVTKSTGVPIMTLGDKKNILSASLASQKQLVDWYSELGQNPTVNFSETINKHGGNIQKAFKKLGFSDKLNAITEAADNNSILNAIKNAQANNTESFKELEASMKNLAKDNNLLGFAKKMQSYVKLAGIGFTAAILGILLPRLNIVMTRKKYEKKAAEQNQQTTQNQQASQNQTPAEKTTMRTAPALRAVSSGVLSFHKYSAQETFKNLLSMVE